MAGYSKRTLSEKLGIKAGMIHYYTDSKSDLEKQFPALKKLLAADGTLWISWPKGKTTDLNGNIVRDIGLKNGLVDVKVIAVDEIWSGLKFVYRLKDRK
jgi:hypothetical protein